MRRYNITHIDADFAIGADRVVVVLPAYNVERTLCRRCSPCKYFPEASSIGFASSVRYGLGGLRTASLYRLSRLRLAKPRIFRRKGRRLR